MKNVLIVDGWSIPYSSICAYRYKQTGPYWQAEIRTVDGGIFTGSGSWDDYQALDTHFKQYGHGRTEGTWKQS